MGDDTNQPIRMFPYDPQWAELYATERRRIAAALADDTIALEHIGSTVIPGISAKPIIDIMIGLKRMHDAPACIQRLTPLGYEYIASYEQVIPERRFLVRAKNGSERTHHIHMVERTSDFWETHILFRDYLRAHPGVARDYEALKLELAGRHRMNRAAYSAAKGDFVQAVLARARAERS